MQQLKKNNRRGFLGCLDGRYTALNNKIESKRSKLQTVLKSECV